VLACPISRFPVITDQVWGSFSRWLVAAPELAETTPVHRPADSGERPCPADWASPDVPVFLSFRPSMRDIARIAAVLDAASAALPGMLDPLTGTWGRERLGERRQRLRPAQSAPGASRPSEPRDDRIHWRSPVR
jgi:hypothetical protein